MKPKNAGDKIKGFCRLIGGHMDCWHSATGATDNGAGVGVATEAMRILKTIGVKPRRSHHRFRNTGWTDHISLDEVGIPGFQFIQDPLEYGSRTHHKNMDTYDRLSANDLMQASIIMASFVYNTATRNKKLPRKPQPVVKDKLNGGGWTR